MKLIFFTFLFPVFAHSSNGEFIFYDASCGSMGATFEKYECKPKFIGALCDKGPKLTCKYLSKSCRHLDQGKECIADKTHADFCYNLNLSSEVTIGREDRACIDIQAELSENNCSFELLSDPGLTYCMASEGRLKCKFKLEDSCRWIPRPEDCPESYYRRESSKNICFKSRIRKNSAPSNSVEGNQ